MYKPLDISLFKITYSFFFPWKLGVAVWVSLSESHHPVEFKTMSSVKTLQLYSSAQIEFKFFLKEGILVLNIKSNGPYLRPSKSSQDPVDGMKFEFCAHSARLLRKLDHVLLWTLRTNTELCRVKKISMTSNVLPYTLPLARPAQAKIQMFTAICSIVKLIP